MVKHTLKILRCILKYIWPFLNIMPEKVKERKYNKFEQTEYYFPYESNPRSREIVADS